MGKKVVLCLQDGSELNYTNLDSCTGLGELKANQTGAKTLGLNLHSTFAVYQLGKGRYLRSTGIWAYNLETDGLSIAS